MELHVQLYLSAEHSDLYSFIVPVTPADLQGMERFLPSKSFRRNIRIFSVKQIFTYQC